MIAADPIMPDPSTVVVAMSGGLDSSFAAARLVERGAVGAGAPGAGAFVTESGEVLGAHRGIHRFTIGQRHRAAPGILRVLDRDKVCFTFDEPQWAVTPEQALVCYDGDVVVGGGWISAR